MVSVKVQHLLRYRVVSAFLKASGHDHHVGCVLLEFSIELRYCRNLQVRAAAVPWTGSRPYCTEMCQMFSSLSGIRMRQFIFAWS